MAEHLARSADGYRLLLDTSTSDLIRFRDLRARAQLAVKNGGAVQAAIHFHRRPSPVAQPRGGRRHVLGPATGVHLGWTRIRRDGQGARRYRPDRGLSIDGEVLTALRRAVEGHPFDEALHSHIITALASTGRRVEALEQFERIRPPWPTTSGSNPARARAPSSNASCGEGTRTLPSPYAGADPSSTRATCPRTPYRDRRFGTRSRGRQSGQRALEYRTSGASPSLSLARASAGPSRSGPIHREW
ncbi:BTAD domain-containing putative transcriptional regulator [Streptomyces sp. NPDC089424]|uniref:AfsR/SARP family transcriptional regulator n=1 Tax=Streptomyces sp. NPDC089424 TaxID=3365917 RepID=UPI0038150528